MSFAAFNHVRITGIETVVPPREICIYDEAHYYGNNVKKIDRMRKMVGFNKRRVVDEDVTPTDLALDAAQKLLGKTKADKNSIDALIFVLQSPDYVAPASAFILHKKLCLPESCMAFDINLGCPGWVYGMYIASSMIESGANKKILLLVADTPSTKVEIYDRINAPLFGDAAAATLLEYSPTSHEPSYFDVGADGAGYEAIITPAGGAKLPLKFGGNHPKDFNDALTARIPTKAGFDSDLTHKYMSGMDVFNFTMTKVPQKIREFLDYFGVKHSDIKHLVLHQANKQIVESVCELAGFDKSMADYGTFETYGNQTVVSVPSAICHALADKITDGNKARVLCSGFGIGLAWGNCLITLDNLACAAISEYKKPADFKNRQESIEYWTNKIKGI